MQSGRVQSVIEITAPDLRQLVTQVNNDIAARSWWHIAKKIDGEATIEFDEDLVVIAPDGGRVPVSSGDTALVRPTIQGREGKLKPVFELALESLGLALLLWFDPDGAYRMEEGSLSAGE